MNEGHSDKLRVQRRVNRIEVAVAVFLQGLEDELGSEAGLQSGFNYDARFLLLNENGETILVMCRYLNIEATKRRFHWV
jgi:hypothetical protein